MLRFFHFLEAKLFLEKLILKETIRVLTLMGFWYVLYSSLI